MQDTSVDAQNESQSNLGEIPVIPMIRTPDMCVGETQKSSWSSGGNGVEKGGDDKERSRGEEYDYIRFQRVEYGDLGKLGPKTKDTELRLGLLPVEAERNDARSVDKDTSMEGFQGSVVGKGGKSSQNLHGPFSTGEMRPEQSRFLGVTEPHGRGHLSQRQEEQRQKMGFQELSFDIRFPQQELWAKPMMGTMPPLNSYFRTEDNKRTISSGGKRIFSDTLPGSPNFMPPLDLAKLPFSHSQLRLPHSRFTFPFAGGPNLVWDSQQGKSNLGNCTGHMGPNLLPALTPEMRIECVGEASSSQVPQQAASTVPASVNDSNQAQTGGAGNGGAEQSEPRAAPVVGWPPIRSFRKNLASQPKVAPIPAPVLGPGHVPAPVLGPGHVPAPAPAPVLGPGHVPAPAAPPLGADPSGKKNKRTMFVKVNMEGVPIGRKIDLKACDSYEKLYVTLDEMFRGSITAQKSDPNLTSQNTEQSVLSVKDSIVVYEDDEGDRMLVGDVPWEMFVSTVKRLHVIKSSKARGLAVDKQQIKTGQ